MDGKGANPRMVLLIIVMAMLMTTTLCLNSEDMFSKKSDGKFSLMSSSLDRDSCIKHCMRSKCLPRYHNSELCFDICHYYCSKSKYGLSVQKDTSLPDRISPRPSCGTSC
ncbi:hypothetical protein Rs2_12854 [Raphanus sativus]|nr:hypothetical protein Rs2_12854 [Raphanus sativus]